MVWDFFAQFQSGPHADADPDADTPPGGSQQNVTIVGGQSGRCVDVPGAATTNGTQADAVGLQRPDQPALDVHRRASS